MYLVTALLTMLAVGLDQSHDDQTLRPEIGRMPCPRRGDSFVDQPNRVHTPVHHYFQTLVCKHKRSTSELSCDTLSMADLQQSEQLISLLTRM